MNLHAPNELGFTLVELLAAMVGSALLLLGLASINAMLSKRLAHQAASQPAELAHLQATLGDIAARTLPESTTGPTDDTGHSLTLTIQPPMALGDSQALAVTLSVEARSDGAALMLRPADASANSQSAINMSTGWQAISLRPLLDPPPAWDPEAPPHLRAISIELKDQQGGEHHLLAATRVDTSEDCVFDPISQTCRR